MSLPVLPAIHRASYWHTPGMRGAGLNLQGRTVLLTGAAGGVGRELADALAGRGAAVVLSGRNGGALEEVRRSLETRGARAAVVRADLEDPREAELLVTRAEEALGPLDVVVNNAGIAFASAYERHSVEEISAILAINVLSPMIVIRAALDGMLERRSGHVVNISSVVGKMPSAFGVAYGTTKAGLIALTRGLRLEYRDRGVGFSAVCPGFVRDDAGGLYTRRAQQGIAAPARLGAVSVARVGTAVVDAIENNRGEVLVTPMPVRPLAAAGELWPDGLASAYRAIGGSGWFERVATAEGRV